MPKYAGETGEREAKKVFRFLSTSRDDPSNRLTYEGFRKPGYADGSEEQRKKMMVAIQVAGAENKEGALLLEQVESLMRNRAYYTGFRAGVTRDELEIFVRLLVQFERFSEYEATLLSDASVVEGVRNYAMATAGWAAHVLEDTPATRRLIGQLEFFGMPEASMAAAQADFEAPAVTIQ